MNTKSIAKKAAEIGTPVLLFLAALPALAGSPLRDVFNGTANSAGFDTDASVPALVGNIIAGILGLVGVAFLGLMIYGGFLWMTGARGGDKKDVNRAKEVIKNSIIGIVVVLGAYAITYFITELVAGETLSGS